jgi:hypothetical protein
VRGRASTGAEIERFHGLAAGELADAGDDLAAVHEEFVADYGVRHEHCEHVALEAGGVRVGGVRRPDQLAPVIADRLLGGFPADLVFLQQLFDQRSEFHRGAAFRAGRLAGIDAAQVADEFLGDLAESLRRLLGHGREMDDGNSGCDVESAVLAGCGRRGGGAGFEEPAVADEGAEGRGDGDVEAGKAVEKPALEHIGAEETPRGSKEGGAERETGAARLLLAEEEVGERIDLRDVGRERRERVVVQVAAQGRDGTGAVDFLVDDGIAAPARAVAAEEAEAVVRIPVAVGDPAAEEPNFARETGGGELRGGCGRGRVGGRGGAGGLAAEEVDDRGAQRRGNFLVGVEREHPRVRGEIERGVLGVAVAAPRQVVHAGAGGQREGFGGVGGVVERDDDLRGPAVHAGEAAREVVRLVFGDDDDGDGERRGERNHGGQGLHGGWRGPARVATR